MAPKLPLKLRPIAINRDPSFGRVESNASEPDSPGSPVSRTPSGMILTSSRGNALTRQRSISAPQTPLYTPMRPGMNWADVMDEEDIKHAEELFASYQNTAPAPESPLYRLQSGLSAFPQLPPDYEPNSGIHSDFTVNVPPTDEAAPTQVAVANDPYHPDGQISFLVKNGHNDRVIPPQGRVFMDDFEHEMTQITVMYLQDRGINPYQGSVPVEKIQNILRCQHRDLYDRVVGSRHRSWNKYVEKHHDFFDLFSIEDGKWRMRLTSDTDFMAGDLREKEAREQWDNHFMKSLTYFLKNRPGHHCEVDDFMAAYSDLPTNKRNANGELEYPLPHRGDFVRFVRRHGANFHYIQKGYQISLIE